VARSGIRGGFEEVRVLLKKIEDGQSSEARECRKLVENCVAAQYDTAFKFGVFHDVLIFESDIVNSIFKEGMERLRESKAIVLEKQGKNCGCLIARMQGKEFDEMESPDKVLARSDGTATYTGKDVIFQLWKFGLLKSDFVYSDFMRQPDGSLCLMSHPKGKGRKFGGVRRAVNVIGMEQAYPQKVIREILRSMGHAKEADNSIHLSYEHVGLEDERFSGRAGTWMGFTADDLYAEGMKRAEGKIKEEVTGDERGRIATAVASAAIRFSFLKTTPEKKITFRWEEAFSLEGDSAPYVMYAHARAHKIFEKAGKGNVHDNPEIELAERELLKRIMMFGFAASEAARHMRPHIVAEYCLDLAAAYNKFYNTCPVLSAEDEKLKENRLAINFAALCVLKASLGSIGIQAPDKM